MTMLASAPARTGEWLADPGFGVYVHIPFCKHRCHYCDFNTYEGMDSLHAPYVEAVVREIASRSGTTPPATSVFFGGGTPTLLRPAELGRILACVRDGLGVTPDAEVTVEANPETVDAAYFESLLEHSFTRVSIGVQSTVPRVLEGLGRTHSAGRAVEALRAARSAGITDLNADLIYGSPWETPADWMRSLETVLAERPDHISAYALTVEEGTPLATMVRTGRVPDVDPDVQADRHAVADEVLGEAGYGRYEVSNWARPGRASRHNVLYWSAGDYLGFGAGAHSHVGGRRWWATKLPRDYIASVSQNESTKAGAEELDPPTQAGEALMLGLRLASGIETAAFTVRYGPAALRSRTTTLHTLEAEGLVTLAEGRIALTPKGTLLANDAICRLL